jgi:hypothetical protein
VRWLALEATRECWRECWKGAIERQEEHGRTGFVFTVLQYLLLRALFNVHGYAALLGVGSWEVLHGYDDAIKISMPVLGHLGLRGIPRILGLIGLIGRKKTSEDPCWTLVAVKEVMSAAYLRWQTSRA